MCYRRCFTRTAHRFAATGCGRGCTVDRMKARVKRLAGPVAAAAWALAVVACFAFIAAVVVVAIVKIPVIAAPALALWVGIGIWLESRWPS
jgi:hypothetical protein